MLRPTLLCIPLLAATQALAQNVDLKVKTGDDQTLRFSIQTKLETNEARKTLINGAEPEAGGRGGGFGGGGGKVSSTQEIVFDQGPASANWRDYKKLAAKETRVGREGEPVENAVEGGLQGKKVYLKNGETGLSLMDGEGEKAAAVNAALVTDVPGRVSLAGLVPSGSVAVGKEVDLSKTFLPALRGLIHPVTPDRSQNADGGGRGGRGQGGGGQGGAGQGGGGQGGGGQGGGGQAGGGRGGMGGGRMGGGTGSAMIQLIGAGKLATKATGKVIGVESKDGNEIATVELTAKLTGKGKSADYGLRSNAFGGRGGRGGRGGEGGGGAQPADNGVDNVDASFDLQGKVQVNLTTQQIVAIDIDGEMKIGRETKRSMQNRDGEEQKMEIDSTTTGKMSIKASCEAVASK